MEIQLPTSIAHQARDIRDVFNEAKKIEENLYRFTTISDKDLDSIIFLMQRISSHNRRTKEYIHSSSWHPLRLSIMETALQVDIRISQTKDALIRMLGKQLKGARGLEEIKVSFCSLSLSLEELCRVIAKVLKEHGLIYQYSQNDEDALVDLEIDLSEAHIYLN